MENILMTTLTELEVREMLRSELTVFFQDFQKDQNESHDERLTRKGIRQKYKISYPTIHKLMKEGMPFEKIGRKTVFRAEDIDKYISERKGGSHV